MHRPCGGHEKSGTKSPTGQRAEQPTPFVKHISKGGGREANNVSLARGPSTSTERKFGGSGPVFGMVPSGTTPTTSRVEIESD